MKPILAYLLLFSLPLSLVAAEHRVPEQHQTIQAAIDAAASGDTILVGPGTYAEKITLAPGITLRSAGTDAPGKLGLARAEATIIDGGKTIDDRPGVTMAAGATLDGFTITKVGRYDEATWQKNWNEQGRNQSHEHIGHFGAPGIGITGVDCKVIHNIVHHVGATGIAIREACSPTITHNVSYRNMGGGIGSMAGSTAIIQHNTCFENFYAGIGHDHASPMVTDNTCYNNVRAGIGISEGACPTVRGNRCYQNRRAGIGVRTGKDTRPLIEDNDCYENAMAGIGADEEAAPTIRNNRCYKNKLAGIGAREHAAPLIVENHCYENQAAGIGIESANATIIHNRSEKNHSAGIGISGTSKATLIGNTCSENRLVAVGIPNGAEVSMHGNVFMRSGGMPPILAILGGSKAVLSGNTIQGGGVAAIMLEGELTATANVLEGKNGGSGILVRPNSKATLVGNTITGYRKDVNDPGGLATTVDN